MTLFILPLSSQNGRISASSSSHLQTAGQSTIRKRKRPSPSKSPSPSIPQSESTHSALPNSADSSSSSPAPSNNILDIAITNPLSLNDDEARQYRTAGLEFDKELPSKSYTGFPHRNLPWEAGFADGRATDGERGDTTPEERGSKASHLKVQHLGVLTAILQRCVAEGDMARASRAWALLLRAQLGGRGVDLRSTGYWGIGAELLIRSGEQVPQGKISVTNGIDDINSDGETSQYHDAVEQTQKSDLPDLDTVRWGTAEGLDRAKDYYARLILQHPYKRQFSTAISALDFWPAMLSCEIYGIQYEQEQSLRLLSTQKNSDDSDPESEGAGSVSGEEASDINDDRFNGTQETQEEAYFARRVKHEARALRRRQEKVWEKREAIRKRAVAAAEKVATRMDELMTTPPFADSHVLHRLRGCLALYIGDLSSLTLWGEDGEGSEESAQARIKRSGAERGELVRNEMREVAKSHFEIAKRRGGRIPDWEDEEIGQDYDESF